MQFSSLSAFAGLLAVVSARLGPPCAGPLNETLVPSKTSATPFEANSTYFETVETSCANPPGAMFTYVPRPIPQHDKDYGLFETYARSNPALAEEEQNGFGSFPVQLACWDTASTSDRDCLAASYALLTKVQPGWERQQADAREGITTFPGEPVGADGLEHFAWDTVGNCTAVFGIRPQFTSDAQGNTVSKDFSITNHFIPDAFNLLWQKCGSGEAGNDDFIIALNRQHF